MTHLHGPLDLCPEPHEVAVPATTPELLDLKRRQIRPHADLVIGEPLVTDPVGQRARHLDFEEIGCAEMGLIHWVVKEGAQDPGSPGGL